MSARLFVLLLAFRMLNAALLQTSAVPDEYWQGLEPAHRWIFGYPLRRSWPQGDGGTSERASVTGATLKAS